MRNHKDCRKELVQICLIAVLILLIVSPGLSVAASEEENIDSFNVHPANRWTESNNGFTTSCTNGLYNVSDTGDGTTDYYIMSRPLSKLDSSIEFRFKINCTGTSRDYSNYFYLLIGNEDRTKGFFFRIYYIDEDAVSQDTRLIYVDYTGATQTYSCSASEDVQLDTWYKLKLNYDYLRSEFTWKMYSDTGTKLVDYDWQDISSLQPDVSYEELFVHLSATVKVDNYIEFLYDYIKAPFKEREWQECDVSSDAQILEQSWSSLTAVDAVSDTSNWTLTIPYLDSFSGELRINESTGTIDGDDWFGVDFRLWSVNATTGELTEVVSFFLGLIGNVGNQLEAYICTGGSFNIIEAYADVPYVGQPLLIYSLSLSDDRSKFTAKARFYPDETDETVFYDLIFSDDISGSSEFVLEAMYVMEFDNGDDCYMHIDGFNLLERNIFAGIVQGIQNIAKGIMGFFVGVFIAVQRFIAGIFKAVGDVLKVAIDALQPLLTAITTAVNTIGTAITTAIGLIQGWLESLGTVITDAIAFIQDWLTDAIDYLLTLVGDIVEAVITFLVTIISDLAELFIDIVFWIYDSGCVALGIDPPPDLLALLAAVGVGFIQLVQASLNFYMHLPALLINFIRLYIIAYLGTELVFVVKNHNVGGFITDSASLFMADASLGLSAGTFHIPVPAGAVFLVFLFADALSGTVFAGFLP